MTGTIYLKTNLENAKAYVGQTWRFEQRQKEHAREARGAKKAYAEGRRRSRT